MSKRKYNYTLVDSTTKKVKHLLPIDTLQQTSTPLLQYFSTSQSANPLWTLIVYMMEYQLLNDINRKIIIKGDTQEDVFDFERYAFKCSGLIVASLYFKKKLLRVYDGVYYDSQKMGSKNIQEASPPDSTTFMEMWAGQPKTNFDWARYEQDKRLLKEYDKFSSYELALIHEQFNLRKTEHDYEYSVEDWCTSNCDDYYCEF